jgi:alpha-1,3/alpha-1,6-mannosyltransferase
MPRRSRSSSLARGCAAAGSPGALRVSFLHPDLGLGGAERLVVDAASSLASRGHSVTVYTSHWEPARAFAETRREHAGGAAGGFAVRVAGDWLPRAPAAIVCALLRAAALAAWVVFCTPRADVYVADQVAAYVLFLRAAAWLRGGCGCRRAPQPRILFYCHYPDQLLAPRGVGLAARALRAAYRAPFDALERAATAAADEVVVNSAFTRAAVRATFGAAVAGSPLRVLYPCAELPAARAPPPPAAGPIVFLSLNRFERKKALELALDAFAAARAALPRALAARTHLVLAGGYDPRVAENVEYYAELRARAAAAGLLAPAAAAAAGAAPLAGLPALPAAAAAALALGRGGAQVEAGGAVTLIRSCSDEQKRFLLAAATAVVYTPSNEHFGIVPVEAMAACRPVVAAASGGPLESVRDGATGALCAPTPAAFGAALAALAADLPAAARMGAAGYDHVRDTFSRARFGDQLDALCREVAAGGRGFKTRPR